MGLLHTGYRELVQKYSFIFIARQQFGGMVSEDTIRVYTEGGRTRGRLSYLHEEEHIEKGPVLKTDRFKSNRHHITDVPCRMD